MKKRLYLFYFVLFSFTAFGQIKSINGEIRDNETQLTLPFVNLGIQNKAAGTLSDADGRFSLKLNETIKSTDTVTISHIGFKTLKVPCHQLNKVHNIITLQPEGEQLKEVLVSFVKPKKRKIGRSAKGLGLMHMNFYSFYEQSVDDRLSKEVGMKFKVKQDCSISDFNFKITSNDFKSLKFRLNFYKVENGLPTEILVEKDIIFEIKDGYLGWYNLDLKPYGILLDKETENIALTIQWVESVGLTDKSKYFGIATAMSASETSYFREKAMDRWKESNQSLSFYLNALCK